MRKKPIVSIIIPTYNSADTIGKCLESIEKQTYSPIETIVVDNFSKDATPKTSLEHSVTFLQEYCNKPEARNIGILASKGEYLLMLDADMCLEPDLVAEAVRKFQTGKCDALFIDEKYGNTGFWNDCRTLEKETYRGNTTIESPRFYTRKVFEKVLFDEKNEGPDEYDFYFSAKKLGLKECRIEPKIITFEPAINFKKRYRHGKYFTYYKYKHRQDEPRISNQTSIGYRGALLAQTMKKSLVKGLALAALKLPMYLTFNLGRMNAYFDRNIMRLLISIQDEFDSVADSYEKNMYRKNSGCKYIDETERKAVVDAITSLGLKPGAKVLDIGAGNGRWTKELFNMGFDVTALDISSKMCKNLKKEFPKVKIINADITKFSSGQTSEKFDLIFSFRAFKYVRNHKRALNNIRGLLNLGGFFVVEMPNRHNPFYFLPSKLSPILIRLSKKDSMKYLLISNFVTEKSFSKELRSTGLKIIRRRPLLFLPHFAFSKLTGDRQGYSMRTIAALDSSLSKAMPRSIIFIARKE